MARFHAPELVEHNGQQCWRVRVLLRRANGQPAQFAQWFATKGMAWRFLEQSCDDDSEVTTD